MMDHVVKIDMEGQTKDGKMPGNNFDFMKDANANLEGLPMGKNLSDFNGTGDEKEEAPKSSEQFFLKMGSLVALVSTCMNTANSMLSAYQLEHWQMALVNAVLLAVLQMPTTLAIFYKFLKDWIKKKLRAFRKAVTELKAMEELHNKMTSRVDASSESARLDKQSGESLKLPNYQSANGVTSHVTEPTILQSRAQPTHARKTEMASQANKGDRSMDEKRPDDTKSSEKEMKSSKKGKSKSRRNKSAKGVRSKSPQSDGRGSVTKIKETTKGIPGIPGKKVPNRCQCACFPLALIRSRSMPNISNKRISLPHPGADLNLRQIEDVSGNPLDTVSGHKKVKSGLKFPWKRRIAGRGSLEDHLPQDLHDAEEGAREQLKSKTDLASQRIRNKSYCLPLPCHRRKLSLISNDFDTPARFEIDDLPDGRARRLPIVPQNISSFAAADNLTVRSNELSEELGGASLSTHQRRPSSLGYTERGNVLSHDNDFIPNG